VSGGRSIEVFPGPGTTYLPVGLSDRAVVQFGKGDWEPIIGELAEFEPIAYERVGVDRALAILADLALVYPSRLKILDVGCSVGTISRLLAAAGHEVTGVDSDVVAAVQEWQDPESISRARGGYSTSRCRFVEADIRSFLAVDDGQYDVALLLSVLHHWLSGYGYVGISRFDRAEIRATLTKLCSVVRRCLYVETPIEDEASEMPVDPEGEFLFPGWFVESGFARTVTVLASTVATNGKPRRLVRVDLS
jgi:SAM-dependent methyltransferase